MYLFLLICIVILVIVSCREFLLWHDSYKYRNVLFYLEDLIVSYEIMPLDEGLYYPLSKGLLNHYMRVYFYNP
jgi:hypothetical protein